ncbi:hypothetical protein ACMFMG_002093 [Clarireedia jacksonii]
MTHGQPSLLPESVFCCDCAEVIETRNSAKPYHDPNRPLHDAIYKSFLSYAQRLSSAKAQEADQARTLAERHEQEISEVEGEEDPEITLLELIRGYSPDRQSGIPVRGPPSPALSPRLSDSRGFDIGLPPFTPPSTHSNLVTTKPGQSFSDFFNNGAGLVSLLNSPPRADDRQIPTHPIAFSSTSPRSFDVNPRFSDLARLLNSQELSATLDRVSSPLQTSSWRSPSVSQSKLHMRTKSANPTCSRSYGVQSANWRCVAPMTPPTPPPFGYALPSNCLPNLTPLSKTSPPWRTTSMTLDAMESPPFIPQRVLSPSNLINNPLTTSPPPPYAIHITSRVDFGPTEAHRYFVCPTDFKDDWPEVSLNQWFAAGVGFDFKAEKWDHKCLKHGRFFRMTLRPNLAMRDWGLGKGMEQVKKMAQAEEEKMKWELMRV